MPLEPVSYYVVDTESGNFDVLPHHDVHLKDIRIHKLELFKDHKGLLHLVDGSAVSERWLAAGRYAESPRAAIVAALNFVRAQQPSIRQALAANLTRGKKLSALLDYHTWGTEE